MVSNSLRQVVLEAIAQAAGSGTLTLLGAAGQPLGMTAIRDTVVQDGKVTLILPDLRIAQPGRALTWSLKDRSGRELFSGPTSDLGWDAPVVDIEDVMEFTDLNIRVP